MRWLVAIVGLAACGRLDFDAGIAPSGDGRDRGSDAGPIVPALVQIQSIYAEAKTGVELLTLSTQRNDLVVVLTTDVHDGSTLSTITDSAGDAYVSVNASFTHSPSRAEVWYVASGLGGATSLTITDAASTDREVWFLEISGASKLDLGSDVSDLSAGTTIDAPTVVPTHVPAAIVSMVLVDGEVQGVASGFSALPVLDGDDAAFAIASMAGSYGPVFTLDMAGTYGAATIAFDAP